MTSCGTPPTSEPSDPPSQEAPTKNEPPEAAPLVAIAPGFEVQWFDDDRLLYGLLPLEPPVVIQSLSREGDAWWQCLSARPADSAAVDGAAWTRARAALRTAADAAGLVCDEARCHTGDRRVELDALRVCHPVGDPRGSIMIEYAIWNDANDSIGTFRTELQDEHVVFMSHQLTRAHGSEARRYVARYQELHAYDEEPVESWARSVEAQRLPGPSPWDGLEAIGYAFEQAGHRTTMWGRRTLLWIEVTEIPDDD